MKVIFLGSPAEVIAPLQAIADLPELELLAVISQPAKAQGRNKPHKDPPVASYAKQKGWPVIQPVSARSPDFIEQLKALQPDLMVTAAYGQILTADFLAIPRRGTINFHPSLLPRYRGATPVQSTLLQGERTTGITVLYTVLELDAGPIIAQKVVDIQEGEVAGQLMERLFLIGSQMVPQIFDSLQDPSFQATPQDQSKITHCTKFTKEDGQISWSRSAKTIENQFRAYTPWPGVFTFLGEQRILVTNLRNSLATQTLRVGEFIFDKKQKALLVGTGDGQIIVERLKPAGKKELDAGAFWNGLKTNSNGFFNERS